MNNIVADESSRVQTNLSTETGDWSISVCFIRLFSPKQQTCRKWHPVLQ